MSTRPTPCSDEVSAALQESEGSDRRNHILAKRRNNLCKICTKVVGDLKPSTPNRWLDFGVDGEGYLVNWDVAEILRRPDVRDRGNWSEVLTEVDDKFDDGRAKTYLSWTLGRRLAIAYREMENVSAAEAEAGEEQPYGIPKYGMEMVTRQPEAFNSIQLARFDSSRSDPGSAFFVRQISSCRQNIPLIRSWIDRCLKYHKGKCQSSSGGVDISSLSLRVIDVEARCVIKASPNCRYVALSYVWGNAKQVLLKVTNEKAFSRPGGLPNGIPATIEDAMALCRMLGERYLWVDALCIYQDSPEDLNTKFDHQASVAEQIRHMDVIYSGAVFTVVNAAASSADDPIPGVRSDSPKRIPPQPFQIGENLQVVATIADAWDYVSSHSTWDTRGWTFQEKILSKRLLVVTEHFSFFRCPSVLWREDSFEADLFTETTREKTQIWEWEDARGLHRAAPRDKDQEMAQKTLSKYKKLMHNYITRKFTYNKDALLAFQGIKQTIKLSVGGFFFGLEDARGLHRAAPNSDQETVKKTLDEYQSLLGIYVTRNFTHDKDALLAFQGIEQTMKPLVGDFFYGLPKRSFSTALKWVMYDGQAKRRKEFPSWSWAGWKDQGGFWFPTGISERVDQDEERILFYQLMVRRPMRRIGGESILSLGDKDVDVCIINKSRLGDKQDYIAGEFRQSTFRWKRPLQPGPPIREVVAHQHLPQPSRPTWQAIAMQLRGGSPLLVNQLKQLLVFYALAIETNPTDKSRNYDGLGYWARHEDVPDSSTISTTTHLQRNWIKVQHWGHKYTNVMLIEWVGNMAYRVDLRIRVRTTEFFAARPQMKLIILG
ncbi:uncharacterized protein TRIVIDRAFT_66183 [Trichoderma virens Gv29-8]|uniref:Heterokaryon incompatibility domain-containing protein n=1 Tax=Hypocrea virens (strain Gv29-8 / FGSC 10586) TaxID=413071 RepID=G9N8C7_HYPVG|nr:uncharacterized protein TRIVIDRAFT_66183 [Trichoderma virens Gv29-8]EHK17235.1 hypothetical protein TRIVIDRAFT_66183 [Trichoderma virens Gv29-8]UKZ55652.1 hypothetical protein TrVGV298_009476 [Trichoderma virens]